MFSTLSKTEINNIATSNFTSANAFNLVNFHKRRNFRPVKAVADDNINVTKKHINLFRQGKKKQCGKMRKCWLPPFSPFPTIISIGFFPRGVKKLALCGKQLKS